MQLVYKPNDKLSFTLEGANQKDVFSQLAKVQEVFGDDSCGLCGCEDLQFSVREVDGNDFYEMRCKKCLAKLEFGQHKQNSSLFPKRQDKDGNWTKSRGWGRWNKDKGQTVYE